MICKLITIAVIFLSLVILLSYIRKIIEITTQIEKNTRKIAELQEIQKVQIKIQEFEKSIEELEKEQQERERFLTREI